MKFLTTIVFCLMCLFTVSLIADCSSAEKKALEDLDRSWGVASTSGDRSALEQIFASDYMGMTPGATENRTQTIETAMRNVERQKGAPQPAIAYDHYIINCT